MTKTLKAICVVLGLVCSLKMILPQEGGSVLANDSPIKGVWAATLYSMDYPSSPTQNAETLRADALKLIENTAKHGFNTLFLQVRPAGDAFYKSEIYPWSKYLTGTEGTAPDDGFDPLEYIISEAHKKGIAVHAWLNPYRLTASQTDADSLAESSIAKKYPHLAVVHTDGKLYLNPGEPEAMQLVIDGAVEIVKNYSIDGIHIDDYFYPSSAFPDGEAFTKYGGSFSSIGDWRRSNTTALVANLQKAIKAVRKDVLFSVSPCGIWANKTSHPDGSDTSGKQAYYDYYADTRLWVKEELVDIIIPQIYWNIGYSLADFQKVAIWWNDTVADTKVALCIGQGVYKVSEAQDPSSPWYGETGHKELQKQLDIINTLQNCKGFVQYRLGSITQSPALSKFLATANTLEATLFTDTKNYPWAEDAIKNLYQKGIVRGMGDGTFGCSRNISRADFTVMLVRLSGQNVPFTENFDDVTEDKYYYKEVGIAKVLGFASGRENNTFDPGRSITREDMATLAWRALTREGILKDETDFSLSAKFADANEISEYARIAVAVMVEKNLLSGYETGDFKPKGLATRAECAVLLNKVSNIR